MRLPGLASARALRGGVPGTPPTVGWCPRLPGPGAEEVSRAGCELWESRALPGGGGGDVWFRPLGQQGRPRRDRLLLQPAVALEEELRSFVCEEQEVRRREECFSRASGKC